METGFDVCPAVVTVTRIELPWPAGTTQVMEVWLFEMTDKLFEPAVTVGVRPKLEPVSVNS